MGDSLALYSDRHAAFKYNARQGSAQFESTQFARGMPELGIGQIFALSPQAKGRVERMASTFQDRLVTELHLEVWPESYWPGFPLSQADVFQSYEV